MANIKSQIKRNRQTILRNERNKGARSSLKTQIKKFLTTVESGDKEAAQTSYRETAQAFDKAASKGIIHKNKAANTKSRLAKKLPS
ncbi:MAG: small subunit ribosomal protein [Actinomycetota bacterium]|jgi:small subunit ribosomal protein S20|nr:small subunit ribosomal protein [Actinomycetota bacterium]